MNCWQEQIHKFKTEYLLIWQKYLSTWTSIKYFGHQVQVSTKYIWISKGQVQVSNKYSIIRIKYQVQVLYLTPTLVACGSNNAFYCWVKRYTWRILGLPLIDYSYRGIKQVLVRMTYTRMYISITIEYVIVELKLYQPSLSSQSITVQFQYPPWMVCSSNNAFYCWTKRWTWRILESHILLS